MGRTDPLPERNAAVLADFARGLTYADLARKYGVSTERIRQIVAKGVREQRNREFHRLGRFIPQEYNVDALRATLNRRHEESA